MQVALKLAQDEANPASDQLLKSVSGDADLADPENVFEEAGASTSGTTRRVRSEVDRRTRLRAR